MKRTVLPGAAVAVAIAVLLAGCAKTDTTSTTPTSAAAQSSSDSNKTTSTAKPSGTDKKSTTTDMPRTGGTDMVPDMPMPDGATMPTNLDKTMADAAKCLEMSMAYAGLFMPLLGGSTSDEDKAKIEASLKDMKSRVPDRIAKDLETIEGGLKKANGIVELGNFLDSDTYKKANDSVTNYLTKECDKVGK